MRPSAIGLAVAAVMILATLNPPGYAYNSRSLVIQVGGDGTVVVVQKIAVGPSTSTISVPLLSTDLFTLFATDQNGSPLSYSFPKSGQNLTVYTLGATEVTLRYDTANLTSKAGTVWTLEFVSHYNGTVQLPPRAALADISGTPYSLTLNNTTTVTSIDIPPGTWSVKYGVSLSSLTTTSGGGGGVAGVSWLQLEEVGVAAGVVAAGVLGAWWWKRRPGPGAGGAELRPDDVQVLNFIKEKGGKVLEPEIRMKFALPKTSAWRQIKRLERLGFLKVTKIGSQNQIELVKTREPGA